MAICQIVSVPRYQIWNSQCHHNQLIVILLRRSKTISSILPSKNPCKAVPNGNPVAMLTLPLLWYMAGNYLHVIQPLQLLFTEPYHRAASFKPNSGKAITDGPHLGSLAHLLALNNINLNFYHSNTATNSTWSPDAFENT